jgi:hypothetical protein
MFSEAVALQTLRKFKGSDPSARRIVENLRTGNSQASKVCRGTCLERLQSTSKGFYFADAVVLINVLQYTINSAHHLKPFSYVRILMRSGARLVTRVYLWRDVEIALQPER